ncbi:peptide ABC transporter ATP-binding protein [Acuticoccus sediminis]|uniref:Peptide ABC transporter ATP-binding protein n=1 Tax=Acuticoccus sediminis TaxID=2184697 RepID=A0A8B2NTU1_9HYPH|nr:ABC transporter ATP-binding protein [Acuticoccus sediminis]RAI02381.1 peptide ABC transporter ATP-binding protein [Acuticoccus sediminis]
MALTDTVAPAAAPLLEVRDLTKTFHVHRDGKRYRVQAVDGISLTVRRGEVLGIVGESGCGKTTVGRSIMGLTRADGGEVIFGGGDLLKAHGAALRTARLKLRMVFQDPYASLNPRRTVGDSVAETGDIHGLFKSRKARAEQVGEALTQVGLDPSFAPRYPHELSGGQRQRVGIARAILPVPDLIIADEPVSALDVSIQAQVLNLLADLKARLGLTMMFISHDLGVVAKISDRVAVLYMGHVVELGDGPSLFAAAQHPYTQMLIASVPRIDPSKRVTGAVERGEPPSRFQQIEGCPFQDRCPKRTDVCRTMPPLRATTPGHQVACHHA